MGGKRVLPLRHPCSLMCHCLNCKLSENSDELHVIFLSVQSIFEPNFLMPCGCILFIVFAYACLIRTDAISSGLSIYVSLVTPRALVAITSYPTKSVFKSSVRYSFKRLKYAIGHVESCKSKQTANMHQLRFNAYVAQQRLCLLRALAITGLKRVSLTVCFFC